MSHGMKSKWAFGSISVASALGLVLCATPRMAGAETPAAPAAQDDNVVIITAQKRSENLQKVPIVVSAFGAQKLQDAGVRDIKDLSALTPGLTVTTTGTGASTTARLRGVGTVSDNVGLEDQVGVVIDGVNRPRNGVAFSDLGELSDIEVIKGPQGTLFGKNTTAGVIQVNTKRPSFDFGVTGEATFSNFGGYGGSVSITGPLVQDVLAGRLYVADRQRDGYYDVHSPAGSNTTDLNDQDLFTTRGQLLFKPRDDFDVNFIVDYTKRNEHCCGAAPILISTTPPLFATSVQVINALTAPFAQPTTANPSNFDAFTNLKNTDDTTDKGISAEAHWRLNALGGATLTSITAARDWKNRSDGDADYTAADLLRFAPGNGAEFKQYSEEARLAGETDRLNWMVGVFLGKENLDTTSRLVYGSQYDQYFEGVFPGYAPLSIPNFNLGATLSPASFAAGGGWNDVYHQRENTQAIFTQETFKVTDKFSLTGGLRFTHEHKTLDGLWSNTLGSGVGCATAKAATVTQAGYQSVPWHDFYCAVVNNLFNNTPNNQQPKIDDSVVTGTAKATYQLTPDFMAYASYSRGFLSGGYNLSRYLKTNPFDFHPNDDAFTIETNTSFAPTYVDAFEIGEKARVLDGKMTLNGALFYQKYKDFQLNQFNGVVFEVTNVPEVVSRGAELDAAYSVTHDLKLNAGVTYADTYYPDSVQNKAALGTAFLFNLPGHRLSMAPLWSLTAGGSYEHPIGGALLFRAAADAKWVSDYNTGSDLDPVKAQKAFAIVNGRVGLGTQDGHWMVELWAQNIFDQYYNQVAFNGPLQTFEISGSAPSTAENTYYAFGGPPRMYGVTLRAKF